MNKIILNILIIVAFIYAASMPLGSPDYLDHLYRIHMLSENLSFTKSYILIPTLSFCNDLRDLGIKLESNCFRDMSNTRFYSNTSYLPYAVISFIFSLLDLPLLFNIIFIKIIQTAAYLLLINAILNKYKNDFLIFNMMCVLFSFGGLIWPIVSGHPEGLYFILLILIFHLLYLKTNPLVFILASCLVASLKVVYLPISLLPLILRFSSSRVANFIIFLSFLISFILSYIYLSNIYNIYEVIKISDFIQSFFITIFSVKFWMIAFAGIFGVYGAGDIFLYRPLYIFLFLLITFYFIYFIRIKVNIIIIISILNTLTLQLLGLWIHHIYMHNQVPLFITGFQGRYFIPSLICIFMLGFSRLINFNKCYVLLPRIFIFTNIMIFSYLML